MPGPGCSASFCDALLRKRIQNPATTSAQCVFLYEIIGGDQRSSLRARNPSA